MIETLNKNYKKQHLVKQPIFRGFIAGSTLLIIYFSILTFANSFNHAVQQFEDMWYWLVLLIGGFSLQVSLFSYMKGVLKIRKEVGAATSAVAATGGVSTTSMIACCAHHVTDIIPILSVSAAGIFLTQFQTLFIIIGVLSNIIGINIMLKVIQKHELYNKHRGVLSYLLQFNMKKTLYLTTGFSILVFSISLIYVT